MSVKGSCLTPIPVFTADKYSFHTSDPGSVSAAVCCFMLMVIFTKYKMGQVVLISSYTHILKTSKLSLGVTFFSPKIISIVFFYIRV